MLRKAVGIHSCPVLFKTSFLPCLLPWGSLNRNVHLRAPLNSGWEIACRKVTRREQRA
jgi:hypothetical protein